MIGVSIARSTRSGSAVGPGICRKWRPTGREEFFDIASPYAGSVLEMVRRPAATSDVEICRHEGRMRESVKPLRCPILPTLAPIVWGGKSKGPPEAHRVASVFGSDVV